MEKYLQWSKQGLSALGTHSAEEAAEMWRSHLEHNVDGEVRDSVRLSAADWAAAERLWTLAPDDTLLTARRGADAKPALLLTGLPDIFSSIGA